MSMDISNEKVTASKDRALTVPCKEKLTLFRTYLELVRKFAAATSTLNEGIGALCHADFELAYRANEAILQDIAAIKIKLETHVKAHQC